MAKLNKNTACSKAGPAIVAHILFIVGTFVFSRGILSATGGDASFGGVLSSAVFWGIIIFLAGVCAMAGAKKNR